jgi:uncharacterized membrane protein YuzA (DUF378 family)
MTDLLSGILSIFTGGSTLTGTETCCLDLDTLTQILIVVGALNWGSIALCFDSSSGDFVKQLAQALSQSNSRELEQLIKGLVGVAGVYQLFNLLLPFFAPGTTIANPCLLVCSA